MIDRHDRQDPRPTVPEKLERVKEYEGHGKVRRT